MTKFRVYQLRLRGEPRIVELLKCYVPAQPATLAEAREYRRAVETLFGNAVQVEILSVERRTRPIVRSL